MTSHSTKKVALVTGASGGIGLATARALRHAGYTAYGTGRRVAAGSSVNGVTMIPCDVTSDQSVADAIAIIEGEAGRIDLLVNNAGIGLVGAAEETPIDEARALFDTNLFGVMRMTNAVLPVMRRQRSGRIVNVSSIMGVIPGPFNALYAASKHAVEGYSESLDHEVRTLGIRVVLVEPGMTKSSFEQNAAMPDGRIADYDDARAGALRWFSEGMKTADAPEGVAAAILHAAASASPKPRFAVGKGMARTALLRRLVPSDAFAKSLRKHMQLP